MVNIVLDKVVMTITRDYGIANNGKVKDSLSCIGIGGFTFILYREKITHGK